MVFSFFRKNKQAETGKTKPAAAPTAKKAPPGSNAPATQAKAPPPAAKPPTPAPAAAKPAAAPAAKKPPPDISLDTGIEVTESGGGASSAIEEAAIYYANDRVDEAIATLEHSIHDHPKLREIQPWLMLFELYQNKGMKQKFEESAIDFVVKFERSSPTWVEVDKVKTPNPSAKSNATGNYFAFTGTISAESEKQFKQLQDVAAKSGSIRLDLSKAQAIDDVGSHLLLEALRGFKKAGVKVQYSGVATLAGLLKQAIETGSAGMEQWMLSLELYQLQDKQAEFEDLAIEYAVAFEVSPPSWEALPAKIRAVEVNEPAPEETASAGFELKGVIDSSSEAKLKELVQYGASVPEIHIDMTNVTRVDFVSVGMFLNILIALTQGGKKVQINCPNEMICALFNVMGVNQFASIVKKAKF